MDIRIRASATDAELAALGLTRKVQPGNASKPSLLTWLFDDRGNRLTGDSIRSAMCAGEQITLERTATMVAQMRVPDDCIFVWPLEI